MIRMSNLLPTIALFAVCAFARRVPAEVPVFPEGAAVLVNGEAITEECIRCELGCMTCANVPAELRAEARKQAVRRLVDLLLVDQHLRARGYTVSKTDVDARLDRLQPELKKAPVPVFEPLDASRLRNDIAVQLRWSKYSEEQSTEGALRKLFQKDRDLFDVSQVSARHILIKPTSQDVKGVHEAAARLRVLRASIEREVQDGLNALPASDEGAVAKERAKLLTAAFGKYAKESSDCPSKAQGGEIGAFPRRGVVVPAFGDAAFALMTFQISDVVQTHFGSHLILVTERTRSQAVSFEDVKDSVKAVYGERLKARLADELRRQANIQVKPVSNAPAEPLFRPTLQSLQLQTTSPPTPVAAPRRGS